MTQQDTALTRNIDGLLACGPLRTWSVVVTILGDLLPTPSDQIEGKTLTVLLEHMGITAQALRVALHRLKKDGWVESTRDGRGSLYRLSASGWAEKEAARDRIYSLRRPTGPTPFIVITSGDHQGALVEQMPPGSVQVGHRIALSPVPVTDKLAKVALCTPVSSSQVPGWLSLQIAPQELRDDFDKLAIATRRVLDGAPVPLVAQTVLRLLTLHHWRRLQFRTPMLAHLILPDDWECETCRPVVMSALDRFPRPDPTQLAQATRGVR